MAKKKPTGTGMNKRIKERDGVTLIYVSHRMPEVLRLCDRISVLRDGKYIGTIDRLGATQDEIVRMMIGRTLEQYFPQHLSSVPGDVILSGTPSENTAIPATGSCPPVCERS